MGASGYAGRALVAALPEPRRSRRRDAGLGRSVTIPRANGVVLLAGGSRSRFSLTLFFAFGLYRQGAMLSLLRLPF
jgi:hypothetical protein